MTAPDPAPTYGDSLRSQVAGSRQPASGSRGATKSITSEAAKVASAARSSSLSPKSSRRR